MESWRLLQLEPAALRNPDQISASMQHMATNGAHLPATLYHLAHGPLAASRGTQEQADPQRVYAQVANRLSELLDDIQSANVERNEKWDSLTLEVTDRNGTVHPARSLSDGTLRFMALAVLELDPQAQGVICLEEPENGIHPERIPAMLRLLRDIAKRGSQLFARLSRQFSRPSVVRTGLGPSRNESRNHCGIADEGEGQA